MNRTDLKSLKLETSEGVAQVPEIELMGILYPKLTDMAVLSGAYRNGVKYKYIRMDFGKDMEFGEYPSVSFFFYDGKYDHREITRKTANDVWSIEGPHPGVITNLGSVSNRVSHLKE